MFKVSKEDFDSLLEVADYESVYNSDGTISLKDNFANDYFNIEGERFASQEDVIDALSKKKLFSNAFLSGDILLNEPDIDISTFDEAKKKCLERGYTDSAKKIATFQMLAR